MSSAALSVAIPTLLSEIKTCVAIQVLAKEAGRSSNGVQQEEAERRSEAAMEKSKRLLVELHKVEGDIAAKSIECLGSSTDASGSSLLPQFTDVHIEWLASTDNNSLQPPTAVAEIVLRDAAVVQRGLVREWMTAALRDTPPSSSQPPTTVSGGGREVTIMSAGASVAVIAVDQSPLNHYHPVRLGGGGEEDSNRGIAFMGVGQSQSGPSYGMGFLEGVQRVAPIESPTSPTQEEVATTAEFSTHGGGPPQSPLSSSAVDDGLVRVHADLLPDGVSLWRDLRATMLAADLEVDVCEAATKHAVKKAVRGLEEKTRGCRGYWVSTSFDRAYGAGFYSTTIAPTPHQAPGQKRPRSAGGAPRAPLQQQSATRTSKLGLVAVYYLVAVSSSSGNDCVAVGKNAFYKLVPGYIATTANAAPVPTQPVPQAPANPPVQQQQQPLSLAAIFPTAVVAPTREMDFVSVLLAFRPKF